MNSKGYNFVTSIFSLSYKFLSFKLENIFLKKKNFILSLLFATLCLCILHKKHMSFSLDKRKFGQYTTNGREKLIRPPAFIAAAGSTRSPRLPAELRKDEFIYEKSQPC
jgi:hypothetical protein